jgi:hypothetical protein
MNKESLQLTGRVVNVNASDQSFLIESTNGPARLRVYASDALFGKLDRSLARAQFYGEKAGKIIGTFHIQGRVLVQFSLGNDLHELTKVLCAAFKEYFANPKEFLAQ